MGIIALIDHWDLNKNRDSLLGQGQLFDFKRLKQKEGDLSFALSSIALIETNNFDQIQSKDKDRIAALGMISVINAMVLVACIANPKACYGSCPTFYINDDDQLHESSAEGFSSAIAPSMEYGDVDALKEVTSDSIFRIVMKNEAFETHAVNQVSLWVVPKQAEQSVFADDEEHFYLTGPPGIPENAISEKGSILRMVSTIDEHEYFSETDSLDLSKKEDLLFEFRAGDLDKQKGLVVNFRQTLLSTFLFYETLSYMGDEVGDYFATLETNPFARKGMASIQKFLGGIECFAWNESAQQWKPVKTLWETGPIAKNLQLVVLPEEVTHGGDQVKIKLRLTKGLWRVDFVGLVDLIEEKQPVKIQPDKIMTLRGPRFHPVRDIAHDDDEYLIAFPGDEFWIEYALPPVKESQAYELFLFSKGYYLEWMRAEWYKYKNPSKLKKMISLDQATWENLAREFKTVEKEMEGLFWNSKYYDLQN